jgi:hypothetical protein
MSFSELANVIESPAEHRAASVDWSRVHSRIGVDLPSDYRAFIDRFGVGSIADFLWIFGPEAPVPTLDFLESSRELAETYKALRASHAAAYPYAVFPEPGGLLAWGISDNGDELWWETTGAADNWPVVVTQTRGNYHERYDMPLTTFVSAWVGHRITSDILVQALSNRFSPFRNEDD